MIYRFPPRLLDQNGRNTFKVFVLRGIGGAAFSSLFPQIKATISNEIIVKTRRPTSSLSTSFTHDEAVRHAGAARRETPMSPTADCVR
jgi:hypothetical protein